MGKMNLLKGSWDGKVGETVGAKWKNKKTIRTYTKPSNPNTQAQQNVRSAFKTITSFVALFADQIRYKTALDVSGMSVRNAIIKLNKSMIEANNVDLKDLLISKGGLQKPISFSAEKDESSNAVKATWTKPTATNFTDEAKMVVVAVDAETQVIDVFEALASAGTASGTVSFADATDVQVYGYYLDKRGNAKVASNSVESTIA